MMEEYLIAKEQLPMCLLQYIVQLDVVQGTIDYVKDWRSHLYIILQQSGTHRLEKGDYDWL